MKQQVLLKKPILIKSSETFSFRNTTENGKSGFKLIISKTVSHAYRRNGIGFRYLRWLTQYGAVLGLEFVIPTPKDPSLHTISYWDITNSYALGYFDQLKNQCRINLNFVDTQQKQTGQVVLTHSVELQKTLTRFIHECQQHNSSLVTLDLKKALEDVYENMDLSY